MDRKSWTITGALLGAAGLAAWLWQKGNGRHAPAAGRAEGPWTAAEIPDLIDTTAVVTGANSGLGYETALALAQQGAHVVLAVRSVARGERAAAEICAAAPGASVAVAELDLADLNSVRAFAAWFLGEHETLELLVNNAGVMAIPRRETADGFEMQFGVNHVGHFALTGLLLPALLRAEESRVVTVSSGAHQGGRINFDDLQSRERYSAFGAYAQSKLANLLFAYELQRRLDAAGASVSSVAAHPGYAATNLQRRGPEMNESRLQAALMEAANRIFAQSAAQGALNTLYAAVAPGVEGGEYVAPDGLMTMRGYPVTRASSRASYDAEAAARLWEISERLTGVQYQALA
ncbi:MAG: oxidoreductase [Candidatus Promineifilaceae bacterium]|nr:oxidoreductase [Candidatus Promineifilaceae bacterium]